ncbi:uncharacterized protein LOC131882569 [Tigriopus californicus]|uniref:uncharacterized protein LOC131882569 n=1 Tax=Tigriopus californicus TaxID=6832 RepID=UPI0027DA1F20|nr:uncharacterized protein LOC131882569 [Tigriopus californicus]
MCPAKSSRCRSCHHRGHWDKVCRSRPPTRVSPPSKSRVGSMKLRAAFSPSPCPTTSRVNVRVSPIGSKGRPIQVRFCADTGAYISVMASSIFHQSGLNDITTLTKLAEPVVSIDGKVIRQLGMFYATLDLNGMVAHNVPIVVCPELHDAFLGLNACKALTIIDDNFPLPKEIESVSDNSANRLIAVVKVGSQDSVLQPRTIIPIGSKVRVHCPASQGWPSHRATVLKSFERRYLLLFDNGLKSWRNRRVLRVLLMKHTNTLPKSREEVSKTQNG